MKNCSDRLSRPGYNNKRFWTIPVLGLFLSFGLPMYAELGDQFPPDMLRQLTRAIVTPGLTVGLKICNIESCVDVIDERAVVIDSKVDVLQATAQATLDKVCAIDLTSQEILDKACTIDSKVDVIDETADTIDSKVDVLQSTANDILDKTCDIDSQIDVVESKIDDLDKCAPTPITVAQTISISGIYCLANDITGEIVIDVSGVDLDLNGHRISGGTNGVEVTSGNERISIKNGIVGPVSSSGILVNTGCSDVTIKDVKAKDCVEGIRFEDSSNSFVKNCDLVSNATGLTLDQSHKIIVDECTAFCNEQAGYSLLTSDTNCFRQCKAMSTGEGAMGDDTNVYGFISDSGAGNIFENCTANATQALTSTVAEAVAAGFAFTGTERCSKIIDSESANVTTAASGIAIPYGILLQSSFDMLETKTAEDHGSTVQSVNWSSDGCFFAIGGNTSSSIEVRVYEFDRTANNLLLRDSITHGAAVNSVQWSPDGQFLAIGGTTSSNFQVRVYEFDRCNKKLTLQDSIALGATVASVDWSPDGMFLAIGGSAGTGSVEVWVAEFDRTCKTLTLVDTDTHGDTVNSVKWSPDGCFLAIGGGDVVGTPDVNIRVYEFNKSTKTLTEIITADHGARVRSVDWSPDGKFLGMGGDAGTGSNQIRVYEFDKIAKTLIDVDAASNPDGIVSSVDWSPDGKFLGVGGFTSGSDIRVFPFDRNINMLGTSIDASHGGSVQSVNWSLDGGCFAIGGAVVSDPPDNSIRLFSGIQFPEKNVIKNNVTYCVEGNECPAGIGISGSSVANLIVDNTAYNNVSNYEFVTNVFDQRFGYIPSPLENISIGGCEPICKPENIACDLKAINKKVCTIDTKVDVLTSIDSRIDALQSTANETLDKVCRVEPTVNEILDKSCTIESFVEVIDSKVDVLQSTENEVLEKVCRIEPTVNEAFDKTCDIDSQLDVVESKIDDLDKCAAIPIAAAQTISTSGIYCLANDITGEITIDVSSVELDLNGHRISGGINGVEVTSGRSCITIKDGVVSSASSSGILINSGCSDVMISHVKAKDCVEGIRFETSSNSLLQNCDLVSNTTGLTLDQSHKIIVDECTAFCNEQAGYSLITSDTNCLRNCKALNTGEGATGEDTNVYGFISDSGSGNIFENCIANATQTLTSTVAEAVAAGFAFIGTERCSKIIDSESANVTTAFSGIAIPYGILLESRLTSTALTQKETEDHGADLSSGNWSPDGCFFAIGGSTTSGVNIRVYKYDRTDNDLILLDSQVHSSIVNSVNWSPDGKFLASAAGTTVQVWEFNRCNQKLTLQDSESHGSTVNSVDWSPDGNFLAIGGAGGGGFPEVRVYEFDKTAKTITEVTTASPGSTISSVNWSPDGNFLAVAGGTAIRVYEFDKVSATKTLTLLDTETHGGTVHSSDWSPDGKFLGIGGAQGTGGFEVRVYEFDSGAGDLINVANFNHGTFADIFSVSWSPDGKFLGIGGVNSIPVTITGVDIRILEFDRNTDTLTSVSDALYATAFADFVRLVNWSPDGGCFAVVGDRTGSPGSEVSIRLYSALEFPTKNIIKGNQVYCVEGNECPAGVGISGSSVANLIIANKSYNNVTSYEFVTNVFDQRFFQIPSPLQNIALEGCEPICNPDNLACKICEVEAKVDIVLSKLDQILIFGHP